MKRLRERRIYPLVLAVSFVAAMPIPALFTTGADPIQERSAAAQRGSLISI